MSEVMPKFTSIRDLSSFHMLVFDVFHNEGKVNHALVKVNLRTESTEIIGIDECVGVQYLPVSYYNLSDASQKKLLNSTYKNFESGLFTMFIHSRVTKIFKFIDEYSYNDFVVWVESGLIGAVKV